MSEHLVVQSWSKQPSLATGTGAQWVKRFRLLPAVRGDFCEAYEDLWGMVLAEKTWLL